MEANEFKCDQCGGVFSYEWTEEEALKEKEDNGWKDIDMDDTAEVCDDCYNKIMGNRMYKEQ